MRGDWLKIWIARQLRSTPRSIAFGRPPAGETWAPISMRADYEHAPPPAASSLSSVRESQHRRLAATPDPVTERRQRAHVGHPQPVRRCRAPVELARAGKDGEALPLGNVNVVAKCHVRVEHAVLSHLVRDETQIPLYDFVGHVDQHHECPSDVERSTELDLRWIRRSDQRRTLVLQAGLRQLLVSLLEHFRAGLDAGVVAGLEILD